MCSNAAKNATAGIENTTDRQDIWATIISNKYLYMENILEVNKSKKRHLFGDILWFIETAH